MLVALKVLAVLTFISYKQTNQQTPNCEYIHIQIKRFQGIQRIFPKWQLLKSMFPSHNFPKVQFPKRQLPKSAQATALGPPDCSSRDARPTSHSQPHCSQRRLRGPKISFGKLPLGKLHFWEVATWENTLGSCYLGKISKYVTPIKLALCFLSNYYYKFILFLPNINQLLSECQIIICLCSNLKFLKKKK